jgi:Flp pilus assembly protein TadD
VKSLSRLLTVIVLAVSCRATAQTAPPTPATAADPQQLFHEGEAALKKNNLDSAERSFRGVLALDPQAAGAYANLGVIAMPRRQWPQALETLPRPNF